VVEIGPIMMNAATMYDHHWSTPEKRGENHQKEEDPDKAPVHACVTISFVTNFLALVSVIFCHHSR